MPYEHEKNDMHSTCQEILRVKSSSSLPWMQISPEGSSAAK